MSAQVVNWPMLESCKVPAPFAPEMARLVNDKLQSGPSHCLTVGEYAGSSQWFEGFTTQMDERTAMSFSMGRSNSPDSYRHSFGARSCPPTAVLSAKSSLSANTQCIPDGSSSKELASAAEGIGPPSSKWRAKGKGAKEVTL